MLRSSSIILALALMLLSACERPGSGQLPTAVIAPTSTLLPAHTPEQIAELLAASVVMIRADFPETVFSYEGVGSGTGIVLTNDGYILTNAHVVEGASAITIAPGGSSHELPARVVGVSACDDLAVIKVENKTDLRMVSLGDSRALKSGEEVVALGYPLGDAFGTDLTVTRGIVSKKEVVIQPYGSLIQTDATINPGNSGGPLVNRYGEVVGVNTLGLDPTIAANTNFAISVDHARSVVADLQKGHNPHWLGMNLRPYSFKDGKEVLVVDAVDSGSPAAHLGVAPADILISLEGMKVTSKAGFCKILRSHADGDRLRMEVLRIADKHLRAYAGEIAIGDPNTGNPLTLVSDEPLSENPSAATGTGVVHYTFDGDAASEEMWLTGQADWVTAEIHDGHYAIQLLNPRSYFVSPAQKLAPSSAMRVSADVLPQGAARAGVATRYSAQDGHKSYYACWIDPANQYGCIVSVNDEWTTLAEATVHDAIRPGQVNQVALMAAGSELTFMVNGVIVAHFTDNQLSSGVSGLYLENFESNAGAIFDNVMIAGA